MNVVKRMTPLTLVLLALWFAPGAVMLLDGYLEPSIMFMHAGVGTLFGSGWALLLSLAISSARSA